MSVRVNLLPHREERRTRGRQHFAVLAGLTALLGLVVVGAGYLYVARLITTQDERNAFLKSEIAKLDKEIAEIKKLKDEIAALLARKQIIETLQADRAQTVHLLDQLVRQMPEGVYLKSVRQRGLCAIECPRIHADAQHRIVAVARQSQAGRDQGDDREQEAAVRIQPGPRGEAGTAQGRRQGAGQGRRQGAGEEGLSHGGARLQEDR
jgi:type IV pilus assembly protein PilN